MAALRIALMRFQQLNGALITKYTACTSQSCRYNRPRNTQRKGCRGVGSLLGEWHEELDRSLLRR